MPTNIIEKWNDYFDVDKDRKANIPTKKTDADRPQLPVSFVSVNFAWQWDM